MNAEDLASTIAQMISALSDKPGMGIIVFVKSRSQSDLSDLALRLAKRHPSGPAPVYMVNGRILGEHSWPFSRIKKQSRIRLESSGQAVTESGGTIFPEDRPIVLLAEDFDHFQPSDQRAYCHLVDGEGYQSASRYALHQGSVLLCGHTGEGEIESGSRSRGVFFDIEEHKG